ncbi:MAG TPA: cyclic nucleotide-binding domain-containing protein [Bacteroidota bacterium]|nr:cyclic nucleotide-binding domain-containing protein [Bacteroidota bacterium]
MQAENLTEILRQQPFLAGLSPAHMEVLVGCASNVHFAEGANLIHEGHLANKFYLIRTGRVALETDINARGRIRIQTVGPGEVLGWSWLVRPYRWHFNGLAVADVRAVALDGECLRNKSENDHDFGYEMLSRLSLVMERRLEATRMQLLDLYTIAPRVSE